MPAHAMIARGAARAYLRGMAEKKKPIPVPYTPIPVTGRTGPRPGY